MTPANAKLHALIAEAEKAKPKGRPRVNRSAKADRTWNGVVYDSKAEMLYHQQHPQAYYQPWFPIGDMGRYTSDFEIYRTLEPREVIEIKGGKQDKRGRWHPHPRRGEWLLRFKRAREIYTVYRFVVMIHTGNGGFEEYTIK